MKGVVASDFFQEKKSNQSQNHTVHQSLTSFFNNYPPKHFFIMADSSETTLPKQQQSTPGSEQEMNPKPEIIRDSYRGSGKLQDKVALITGGDSGIGRSAAVHFAREGADVAIVYLDEQEDEDAQEAKRLIEKEGRKCLTLRGKSARQSFCARVRRENIQPVWKIGYSGQ